VVRALGFALLRISRAFERAGRGLFVASLTRVEIDRLAVEEWESFSRDSPVEEPFPWEAELFARHVRSGDAILIVGAGGGRDAFPLLAKGHAVTALDVAPRALQALAERARARDLSVPTIQASITEASLPRAAFDVVLFSWFCLSYLHGPEERGRALFRSAQALRPGGRILLSYPFRGDSLPPPPAPSWLARFAARWLGGMTIEPGDDYTVSGTISRPSVFFTHPFRPKDIENEVRGLGFHVVFHDQHSSGVGVLVLEPGAPSA
jgi:SAM-dependent methyltransferase